MAYQSWVLALQMPEGRMLRMVLLSCLARGLSWPRLQDAQLFHPTSSRSLPTSRKDPEGRKRAVVACENQVRFKGLECTCFTAGSMGKPLKISEVKACDDESDLTSRRTLTSNHWH